MKADADFMAGGALVEVKTNLGDKTRVVCVPPASRWNLFVKSSATSCMTTTTSTGSTRSASTKRVTAL